MKMSFGRIAIIPIEGPIGGMYFPLLEEIREKRLSMIEKYLEQAKRSRRIKAVILKINSPGGKVYPCKRLVERVKEIKKFTVAQIEEIGTSGAYWIASWCDVILADDFSLVGGIGATSIKLDLSGLMRKLGINFDSISSGKYKELGSPFRKSTEEERKIREEELRLVTQVFVQDIKMRRKLKKEDEVLQGRVYRGREAKDVGLIDDLGGERKAIELCRQRTGAKRILNFKEKMERGLLSRLFR